MKLNSVAQATADVAGASSKLDAASAAGLPGKEAAYERTKYDASRPLAKDKVVDTATDAASATVAAGQTPGYYNALKSKSLAENAAHIQVAGAQLSQALTLAQKPDIVTDADGNILMRSWNPKTNNVTTQPLIGSDGKPMKGPKDLDERTKLMANALLVDAKAELDPEKRTAMAMQVVDLLKNGPQAVSPKTVDFNTLSEAARNKAIADLKANPNTADKFDALFGKGKSAEVLGSQSTPSTPPAKTSASTSSTTGSISQSEPADSPASQWKARQAKMKADKEAWDAAQSDSAQKLFGQTNLKDVQSAQALQDSPLFTYLTPQQRAQVQSAVMGRSR